MNAPRWQHCVTHAGSDLERFVHEYVRSGDRACLLVAGAGFDPRTSAVARLLSDAIAATSSSLEAFFIREQRPTPGQRLMQLGDKHTMDLQSMIPGSTVIEIVVLAESDRAVVGGQRVISAIASHRDLLDGITDVMLDVSALSLGISFPLARYLSAVCAQSNTNLHVFAASSSGLDDAIKSIPSDVVDPVRGFSGQIDYENAVEEPKIWLPHLARNRTPSLQRILDSLKGPVKVCPVVPLSQTEPKAGDRLLAEYEPELMREWKIDPRDLIYALDDDPLDLYRTISAIYQRTQSVFKDVVRTHLVLSPSGNKVLAIGALMAALEHDIAVRYVESVGYEVDWDKLKSEQTQPSRFVHVWLQGDPYQFHETEEAAPTVSDQEAAANP
ncbi:hypothetical protein [Bradyrhizobium sp. USDA 3315]